MFFAGVRKAAPQSHELRGVHHENEVALRDQFRVERDGVWPCRSIACAFASRSAMGQRVSPAQPPGRRTAWTAPVPFSVGFEEMLRERASDDIAMADDQHVPAAAPSRRRDRDAGGGGSSPAAPSRPASCAMPASQADESAAEIDRADRAHVAGRMIIWRVRGESVHAPCPARCAAWSRRIAR